MDILEEVKSKSDQAQSKAESKTDFDVQREEAISDLAKSSAKKAFSVSKQFPQVTVTSYISKKHFRKCFKI